MDFDQMLHKLDAYEYNCAQDFLDDIDLIAENAIKYNSDLNYETNKVICHRAHALKDFAYALVKAEMDTDFEDECKDIVTRRKKLTHQLKHEGPSSQENGTNAAAAQHQERPPTIAATPSVVNDSGTREPEEKRRSVKRKRSSNWSRGLTAKRRAHKKTDNKADPQQQQQQHEDNDEEEDEEQEELLNGEADEEPEKPAAEEEVGTLVIDKKGLTDVEKDLLARTNEMAVEPLERMHCKMMECVERFKQTFDRTKLVPELKLLLPPPHSRLPNLSPGSSRRSH